MKKIIDGAWLLPLPAMGSNTVLLQGDDGELALIDAGLHGHTSKVIKALASIGRRPEDLSHLVFTHAHADHIGGGAEIAQRTSARTWMHHLDAGIARSGGPFRLMTRNPGLVQRFGFRFAWDPTTRTGPIAIDEEVDDGQVLPIAGGLTVVHTPGHTAGHISLLWKQDQLLIVGDAWSRWILRPADPVGFEDAAAGRRSQERVAGLNFKAVSFGHGEPIVKDAKKRLQAALK